MTKHPLADSYRAERQELLRLARGLSDEQSATITTACPAWSIKDVFAHLAGIGTDILSGNTEGAATEPWADAHVSDRLERSFTEVLDEWQASGDGVSDIMDEAGEMFPVQLFVDQWTHGWDVRATLGQAAAAAPDLAVYTHFLPDLFEMMSGGIPDGLAAVTLQVADQSFELGSEPSLGELELDLFEFARITMGRRSQSQLDALPWPPSVTNTAPYIDQLVYWSVNEHDVIDPVS